MLGSLLGTGWKTLTGALLWAIGHIAVFSTLAGLVGLHLPNLDGLAQSVGTGLAVVGVAHKVNRFDLSAFLNTLLTALQDYVGRTTPPPAA
jgi:hypothetical protein